MRIVGLVIVLVLLVLGMVVSAGRIFNLIDTPSAIMVVGLTLGMAWQAGTPLLLVIRSFFSSNLTPEEIERAVAGWVQVRTFLVIAGVMGTFVGLLSLFHAENVMKYFFPGVATALITTFYGLLLSYVIFLPHQRRLEAKIQA